MHPSDAKLIGRSSVLNGPNGVYVGPDGNVYAASVIGDEITVHDPRTGDVLDRIGPERGVHGPDDLVIAPDGTIYWTELIAGNVGMLRPDGTFVTQFVGPGVNPITLSADGRLFVARAFLGNGLYELDPQLTSPPQLLNGSIVGLNGMDFGPDGLLYGPLFFDGTIVRIDVDGPGSPEVVATGFTVPGAVAFDSVGRLHAVDFAEGQVLEVDIETGERDVLADIEGVLDNLAFGPDDRLYTTAFADGQILTLTPGGQLRALNRPGFIAPSGIAVGHDGTVWIADFFSLRGFGHSRDPETSFYERFAAPGTGIATTNTVSVDGHNLITTGWFSNAVQVLDPTTGDVLEDIRNLAVPTNAIRHGGMLVASQALLGNVVNAQTPGEVLLDGLALPLGLASDGATLYVSDWGTGQIWAVEGGDARVVASGLSAPEGVALDGDQLLVVEAGADRLTAVDLQTGATSPVVEGLELGDRVIPAALPHGNFNGVAVGPGGSIYVTADGSNAAYELKR